MALGGEHLRCDCPVEACCWSQMGAKSVLASLGSKGPSDPGSEGQIDSPSGEATPYEHKHVMDLMARFRDLEDCEERFAIYGTCWRRKNKHGQFPWAALRETNDGFDFGQMMMVCGLR